MAQRHKGTKAQRGKPRITRFFGINRPIGEVDHMERFSAMYRRFRRGDACFAQELPCSAMLRTAQHQDLFTYSNRFLDSGSSKVASLFSLLPSYFKFRRCYNSITITITITILRNLGISASRHLGISASIIIPNSSFLIPHSSFLIRASGRLSPLCVLCVLCGYLNEDGQISAGFFPKSGYTEDQYYE